MHCVNKFIYGRRVMLLRAIPALNLTRTVGVKQEPEHLVKFYCVNRMASGETDDSIRKPYMREKSSVSEGPIRVRNNDDPESHFSFPEDLLQRPSTSEDETHVKMLLKEILAMRNTHVSSWIVESKLKHLCAAYKFLLKPHRFGFLKVMALDYSVDHQLVKKSAESLLKVQDVCDPSHLFSAEERLKNHLTPQYSWLFMHVGRLENGVKFLVDMRTDLLMLISETKADDSTLSSLQQLNITVREMLSLWFSVGFLNLERITWRSPCEMLQKISDYEAVHPVRSWTDLKRRVGPYRRCFVYTHSSMPFEPIVVLHTALSDNIPSSMRGIVSAATRMSLDASTSAGVPGNSETEDPTSIKAAIFYSITSTQKGLQGIELGNYLIKRVVKEVQAEFPQVSKFSTLSPIPTFRLWFLDKIKAAEKGSGALTLFTQSELKELQPYLGVDNFWSELRRIFKTGGWMNDHRLLEMMEVPLMRLCARYLYLEKRRGYAFDSVANFHLRNGAVMWRLNWRADVTPRGMDNSYGMMVNYRYFLPDTETNSQNYLEKQYIASSEQISKLASAAGELMLLTSSKI